MTNWKNQYNKLAALTTDLMMKINEQRVTIDHLSYMIGIHIDNSDRSDLRDRNVNRFMRLKEDIKLSIQYENYASELICYPAGTLIQCGKDGHVYLDNDGDGNLYFPEDLLESVEVDSDSIDWNSVIRQG